MKTTAHLLAALLLAGCAADPSGSEPQDVLLDEPGLDEATDEGRDFVGQGVVELGAEPRILSFDVSPAALPLGGGTVLVSWEAEHVAGCALRSEVGTLALASEAEVEVDLDRSTELRLLCLDEDQDLVAEAGRSVAVAQVPDLSFEVDEDLDFGDGAQVGVAGVLADAGSWTSFGISVEQAEELQVDLSLEDARAQVELWLASDLDGSGDLQADEVLAWARSGEQPGFVAELEPGAWSLFVVARTAEVAWSLDLALGSALP